MMRKVPFVGLIPYLAIVMEARVRMAPFEQIGLGRPRRVVGLRAQSQAQRPHQAAVVIVGSAAADQQELKRQTIHIFAT